MELVDLNGIGDKRISALNNAGIFTCNDLLNYLPYKYYDFSEVSAFDRNCLETRYYVGTVIEEPKCVHIKKLSYVLAKVNCKISNKTFFAVWYNQPFIKNVLQVGEEYFFLGKPNNKGWLVVNYYKNSNFLNDSKLIPIYKTLSGLGSKMISNLIVQIINNTDIHSYLDSKLDMSLKDAYYMLHFPSSLKDLDKAKERIALEDMLSLVSIQEKFDNKNKTKPQKYSNSFVNEFIELCPFKLTNDQFLALNDIYLDMSSIHPMNRLLLGDVGSGKTIVALGACYIAYKSGYQSVILAPTEILARQHYKNAKSIYGSHVNIAFISSGMKKSERKIILDKIKRHEFDVIIGTHSVFSQDVEFDNLSLVITDEQHRFGVSERAKLSKKAIEPDTLIMSATPIPRSLALVFFGDLKITKIIERPNGETKIKTNIVPYQKYNDMLKFLKNQIELGSKCFIITPRIEDDDISVLQSIEKIKQEFASDDYFKSKFQVLHGKQSDETKNSIIENFKNSSKPILISTTVVEVGIDVPDANIIIIHNSDRFGLATLHQLRGRVGRNGEDGYCFCLTDSVSETSIKRLKLFKDTNDGFKLSEEDYKMRGSGTILGTRQHGVSEIMSSLYFSIEGYEKAKKFFNSLDQQKQRELEEKSKERFDKLYSNIVLN